MARSSSTGLPYLVRRSDTGKFSCHRDLPASVVPFVSGEISLPWSRGTHLLGGRPTIKASLKTGHEATARVRWNRVHEQVEGLVQMGDVLAAKKEQRRQAQKAVERLPSGTVATIAAQAKDDEAWIDSTLSLPST